MGSPKIVYCINSNEKNCGKIKFYFTARLYLYTGNTSQWNTFLGIKRITFEEFLPILHAVSQKCPKKPKPEEFFEGLKVFDKDGYGVVMSGELRHVLTGLGELLIVVDIVIDSCGYSYW